MYSKEQKDIALRIYHQTESVTETIRIGRIKNEMFYNADWSGVNISEFIGILNDYLYWYNEKRIKKTLGYLSPIEYRHRLGLVT